MRKWNLLTQEEAIVREFSSVLSCPAFFSRVLYNRGLKDKSAVHEFLNIDSALLLDPYLFKDMEAVVHRIGKAIRQKEPILVYGDYDVDGITSTSLLLLAIRELGGVADYYIPSRFTEGYGLNLEAIHAAAKKGTALLITVDTGITAVSEVEEAKRLGMDVIITDHHECQETVPDSLILNPKYAASGYPFKDLAGVGVVYKLATALNNLYGDGTGAVRYTPLTAIGTVADIMPLRGENRYIVWHGLSHLHASDLPGLRILLDRCAGEKPIDTFLISFVIAPRINASGRLGNAENGVKLLTTSDPREAEELVDYLCNENNRRQEIENQILAEAIEMLEGNAELMRKSAIVLWHENWNNGVVGIVASRLKERYKKPCILFSIKDDLAKGSGRSISPFNLFETFQRISDVPERFGGHAFAAGVLVRKDRLEEFREAFCAEVDQFLKSNSFDDSIDVDCELAPADLELNGIRMLNRLAPFGRENELPVFMMKNVILLDSMPTSNRNHMRLVLQCENRRIVAFYFNKTPEKFPYVPGDLLDLVFTAEINTYNGRQNVQLTIQDLRCGEVILSRTVKEIARMEHGRLTTEDIPDRDDMAAVYLFLKTFAESHDVLDICVMPRQVRILRGANVSLGKCYYALKILKELGIIRYSADQTFFSELAVLHNGKADLNDSVILKNISRKAGVTG